MVQSPYHTMLQAQSGHLGFRRDMILSYPFVSDLEYIRRHKQEQIDKRTETKIRITNCTTTEYVRK